MKDSTSDPLSGLPQPNQGINPSPLKDAGSVNESKGERWWLNDSVQPHEIIGEHAQNPPDADDPSTEPETTLSTDRQESEPTQNQSQSEGTELTEPESLASQKDSGGGRGLKTLIGIGVIALVLYQILSGV